MNTKSRRWCKHTWVVEGLKKFSGKDWPEDAEGWRWQVCPVCQEPGAEEPLLRLGHGRSDTALLVCTSIDPGDKGKQSVHRWKVIEAIKRLPKIPEGKQETLREWAMGRERSIKNKAAWCTLLRLAELAETEGNPFDGKLEQLAASFGVSEKTLRNHVKALGECVRTARIGRGIRIEIAPPWQPPDDDPGALW